MSKNVFLTGATGFLGSYLAREILRSSDDVLYCLARPKKDKSAQTRIFETIINIMPELQEAKFKNRITVLDGDVSKENLGLNQKQIKDLSAKINSIFHCAAIAEFRIPLDIIRKTNVEGTRNVLELALKCRNLDKVNHISTTFVAGTHEGEFSEDDLDVGQSFNNSYEQSKFEAELLAEDYKRKGLPVSIFRPSIVTGDFERGHTSTFKMIYDPLHFFSLELFEEVPADIHCKHNLIPVDIVAQTIFFISSKEKAPSRHHIISPKCFTFQEVFFFASDFFGYKNPQFIMPKNFDSSKLTPVQQELLRPFMAYFNYKTQFISNKKHNLANQPKLDRSFLVQLFTFCLNKGFIKQSKNLTKA